jgi:hypothetical protein
VKQKNRQQLDQAQHAGRVRVLLQSVVEQHRRRPCHAAARRAGAAAAQRCRHRVRRRPAAHPLLQKVGIRFETKFGTA